MDRSPARLLRPWDFPGKNAGVGSHFLLQGIFPTQGLNPCLCIAGGFFTAGPPGSPVDSLTTIILISMPCNQSVLQHYENEIVQ